MNNNENVIRACYHLLALQRMVFVMFSTTAKSSTLLPAYISVTFKCTLRHGRAKEEKQELVNNWGFMPQWTHSHYAEVIVSSRKRSGCLLTASCQSYYHVLLSCYRIISSPTTWTIRHNNYCLWQNMMISVLDYSEKEMCCTSRTTVLTVFHCSYNPSRCSRNINDNWSHFLHHSDIKTQFT